jgi:hypothetical protein
VAGEVSVELGVVLDAAVLLQAASARATAGMMHRSSFMSVAPPVSCPAMSCFTHLYGSAISTAASRKLSRVVGTSVEPEAASQAASTAASEGSTPPVEPSSCGVSTHPWR